MSQGTCKCIVRCTWSFYKNGHALTLTANCWWYRWHSLHFLRCFALVASCCGNEAKRCVLLFLGWIPCKFHREWTLHCLWGPRSLGMAEGKNWEGLANQHGREALLISSYKVDKTPTLKASLHAFVSYIRSTLQVLQTDKFLAFFITLYCVLVSSECVFLNVQCCLDLFLLLSECVTVPQLFC